MFRVKESIHINAPVDRCFLLSTSVSLVQKTLGMRPVEGKTSDLVTMGDRVLWRGWKFGIPVSHETLITGYDRPHFFQDSMASGRFKHFHHDHRFDSVGGQTLLVDTVQFSLPFGALGRWIGRHIVVPHVLLLMRARFARLKRTAESRDWEHYIPLAKTGTDPQ